MRYAPKKTIDPEAAGEAITRLLGITISNVSLRFEAGGYSGCVYRLVARTSRGETREFLLKGVTDESSLALYHDVLRPYQLNSPVMYGITWAGGDRYLVMDYIPHEPTEWNNLAKYRHAVDWLLYKDRIAEGVLPQLRQLPYIRPFDIGALPERLAIIRRACEDRLDPCLTGTLVDTLECNGERFCEFGQRLRSGPQTITHNDFQMLNILFATGARLGKIYVVDWTHPAAGSVCIDLAALLHAAPAAFCRDLISQYRNARPVPNFRARFVAARAHVNLGVLAWMISAIRAGQSRAVYRPKMRQAAEQLLRAFAPCQPGCGSSRLSVQPRH